MDGQAGEGVQPGVSAEVPDWSRERPRALWDPSRRLLRAIRGWQAAQAGSGPMAVLRRKWWTLEHRLWSVVTGADIPVGTRFGGGLILPHPNGIVIHTGVRIGPNCMLFQQVTPGTRSGHRGAPQLGGHVDIGAGARVLGPVTIGDHAVIGANAVVLCDVPPGCRAVGIPARILPPAGPGGG